MLDFLVDVRSDDRDTAHLRFAFETARRMGAHLTGLQVISIDASVIVLPEPLLVLEDEEHMAHERGGWWASACRSRGIDGTWEVRRGVHRRILVRRASLSDVLIGRLTSSGSGIPEGTGLLARVLKSRVSPLILVPDHAGPSTMQRMLIAWNGSAVAARAIRSALPFLSCARSITILAGDREGRGRRDDADMLLRAWLSRHALLAEWVELDRHTSAASAILEGAEAHRADVIVMGAWGRSRMREMALGGTTRDLLAHGRVPLFMAA